MVYLRSKMPAVIFVMSPLNSNHLGTAGVSVTSLIRVARVGTAISSEITG